ncbi:UvrD-helicase domain-containing protein, partial [uncultured Pseudoalteromonas sp.]|uniref:UvrD-helicase domain-containing protein n=1 Tax=uncultured Pseudoalteromonas sp. TaxID=114053 RepID=UPI00338D9296
MIAKRSLYNGAKNYSPRYLSTPRRVTMQALNPLTMPLKGQSLIEASAGTGKTYTITGLYLRYLLGMQIPGELST